VRRAGVLHDLTRERETDREVVGIESGRVRDAGAERRERVEALATHELAAGAALGLAGGDVVERRDAADRRARRRTIGAADARANDEGHLGLVVGARLVL